MTAPNTKTLANSAEQCNAAELIDGYYLIGPGPSSGDRDNSELFEQARSILLRHLERQLAQVREMPYELFREARKFRSSPDPIGRRVKHIQLEIEGLRNMLEGMDPVDIQISPNITIELGSLADQDERVWVGRKDWGGTCVNYTEEGLILDVLPQDEIDSLHTVSIPKDELESDLEPCTMDTARERETSS